MRRAMCLLTVGLFVLGVCTGSFSADQRSLQPEAKRLRQLASWLPAKPVGVGRPISDRAAWERLRAHPKFAAVIREAERLVRQPMPELTDDLYLDFSRTGNRTRCQRVMSRRYRRVSTFVLAECLENKGRFLKPLEEAIRSVCAEKTWVLPAHDRSLRNFRGQTNEIDLQVAAVSWNLATALWWLQDRLAPDVRKLIYQELEKRTFRPFESAIQTGSPRMWWLTGTNNWNAVCLAGTVGAALAAVESRERRAFFVGAAEKSIRYFLSGFTPDGYCSEGLGYWNYGFGHFVLLAETLYQATNGRVDWLKLDPKIQKVALFGYRLELTPGVYPAFADCHVGSTPATWIMGWVSRKLGLGLHECERRGLGPEHGSSSSLFATGLLVFPNSATACPAAPTTKLQRGLRDWFEDAGVLICRQTADQPRFAAALKGGHNAEHHNHNDVGSFVVALGRSTPLLDPGSEVYTARTFSSRRYESKVLNSYGHPVPVVAGQLQRPGRSAAAKVLAKNFTPGRDELQLDLTAAYRVKELKTLRRTFVFSRSGLGKLTVTDTVEFRSPQAFGTALITFSSCKRLGPNRLLVGEEGSQVEVVIDSGGQPLQIRDEILDENLPGGHKPTRIGIDLADPVRTATLRLIIQPSSSDRATASGINKPISWVRPAVPVSSTPAQVPRSSSIRGSLSARPLPTKFSPFGIMILGCMLCADGGQTHAAHRTAVRRLGFSLENARVPVDQIVPGGPPKDGIPAISSPKFISAKDAKFLKPQDRVVGIEIKQDARAYPLKILNWHEAVNDNVGGVPVLVTYCPLCDSAAVFDRRIKGREVEFGISGLLYNSNVLLYDRSPDGKESLWSQLRGEAVAGPRSGEKLRFLPTELTTWRDWRSRHPDTRVLSTDTGYRRIYSASPYTLYFQHNRLMFPVQPLSRRLPLKAPVLGVWTDNASRAYPVQALASTQKPVELKQTLDGKQFVLRFEPRDKTVRVVKHDPGLRWAYSFWFAWYAFHPETEVFGGR